MKKLILVIEFDDTDGYKGHGDDTGELIKETLENELKYNLEADGVIKEGWKITSNTPTFCTQDIKICHICNPKIICDYKGECMQKIQ